MMSKPSPVKRLEHFSNEKTGIERTDIFIESVHCPPNVPPLINPKALKAKEI